MKNIEKIKNFLNNYGIKYVIVTPKGEVLEEDGFISDMGSVRIVEEKGKKYFEMYYDKKWMKTKFKLDSSANELYIIRYHSIEFDGVKLNFEKSYAYEVTESVLRSSQKSVIITNGNTSGMFMLRCKPVKPIPTIINRENVIIENKLFKTSEINDYKNKVFCPNDLLAYMALLSWVHLNNSICLIKYNRLTEEQKGFFGAVAKELAYHYLKDKIK